MSTKKFNNLKNATGTIIKRAREEKKMSKKDLSKELELYSRTNHFLLYIFLIEKYVEICCYNIKI